MVARPVLQAKCHLVTCPITSSHDTVLTSKKINKSQTNQTKGQMGSSWHLKRPVEEAHTSFVEVNTNGLIRDFLLINLANLIFCISEGKICQVRWYLNFLKSFSLEERKQNFFKKKGTLKQSEEQNLG